MKTVLVLIMILCLCGAAGPSYAQDKAHNHKDQAKVKLDPIDTMEDGQLDLKMAEATYEALNKHTLKYQEAIKQDRDALVTIMLKAKQDRDDKKAKEISAVLDDYNTSLVNLDLMLVILNMRNMINDVNLPEYYKSQKENQEKIKYGFSIKNEMYLAHLDGLKDAQATAYETALLKNYREYCIFDINNLNLSFNERGNVVEAGKTGKEGLTNIKVKK